MPKGSGLTKPYKLSPELSDVVGKKEATRGECMKQLWAYIKEHKLQDPENKQYFKPDKKMAKIFGEDKLRGFSAWPNTLKTTCPKFFEISLVFLVSLFLFLKPKFAQTNS